MSLKKSFLRNVLDGLAACVMDRKHWALPDVSKLPDPPKEDLRLETEYTPPIDPDTLIHVLNQYHIHGVFKDYHIGASVTTYEVTVPVGTHLSSITRYQSDLARDLGTPSLRIIKSINDSATVGFEVANTDRYTVHFKQLYKGIPEGLRLPIILGEDTYGVPVYQDLAAMPHLLVAGTTGSGKSAFLNAMIATLICKMTPDQLRFIIVDPKGYEFAAYRDLPHMFCDEDGDPLPIASEAEEARHLLDIAVEEMERRGQLFNEQRVKKLEDYNAVAKEPLPYVVFIVDEFADLMAGNKALKTEVQTKIQRLAQKARAVGIHCVLATQKPTVEAMSSQIKGNMPARIAFSVTSGTDSRVILDEMGAENLIGGGDMIFCDPSARGDVRFRRIQAPWLSDNDLNMLLNQGGRTC